MLYSIMNQSDKLDDFCIQPISGDIMEVPGLTENNAILLTYKGVWNTYNLIGKYLSFKDQWTSVREHQDRFLDWLRSTGISNDECMVIWLSIAEKTSTFMPGLYDPSVYAE